jgi:hypothetical protein
MTALELRSLQPGDRILFRNQDSIDEQLRTGVVVEVLKIFQRVRGRVLLVHWDDDDVEIRPADYSPGCFERI